MLSKIFHLCVFMSLANGLCAMTIFEAAQKGDLALVQEMVGANHDVVSLKDEEGRTPLLHAAKFGQLDVVALLVDSGADVNAMAYSGETALALATRRRSSVPLVQFLLARGACANVHVSGQARTPLMRAAALGDVAMVKALVTLGRADLLARDSLGHSVWQVASGNCGHHPSHWAAEFCVSRPGVTRYLKGLLFEPVLTGDTALLQQLLCQGARADVCDDEGKTPLMLAAERGHVEHVRILAHWADVNARGSNGATAICLAVEAGHEEVMYDLIGRNANVDIADNGGMTPLMWAAANNRIVPADLLIHCTKVVDARDQHGRTALMIAASMGNIEIVRLLARGHARVDLVDAAGKNALMYAAEYGRDAVVQFLVDDCHVPVDAVDISGRTALMHAAANGRSLTAQFLCLSGANVMCCDHDNKTAADCARDAGFEELAKKLTEQAFEQNLKGYLG